MRKRRIHNFKAVLNQFEKSIFFFTKIFNWMPLIHSFTKEEVNSMEFKLNF